MHSLGFGISVYGPEAIAADRTDLLSAGFSLSAVEETMAQNKRLMATNSHSETDPQTNLDLPLWRSEAEAGCSSQMSCCLRAIRTALKVALLIVVPAIARIS